MLNELLFTLFLTQVGTVAVITACIVGAMALFMQREMLWINVMLRSLWKTEVSR